jgi:hypothetical protein
LRVNVTINGLREKLAKAGSTNIAERQNGLTEVLAVTIIVVARGRNADLRVSWEKEYREKGQSFPDE